MPRAPRLLFSIKVNHGMVIINLNYAYYHGRTGRKKLGGRKEICPTFSDCALVVKKYFPEKLSKIVVDGGREEGVITKNSY